jgi:hypothetical protein
VKSWWSFACPSIHIDNAEHPSDNEKPRLSGYAMNMAVIRRPLANLDLMTPLFFETDALGLDVVANVNAIGYRHERWGKHLASVVYADGHAKHVPSPGP